MPLYCVLLAVWIGHLLEKTSVPVWLILAGIGAFAALQTGGMALRIKQNTNGNFYRPTIQYLTQNLRAEDTLFGGSELVFGLNFSRQLIGDARFGQITGRRPRFIVYDDAINSSWRDSKEFAPEFYDYFPHLLEREYKIVYENAAYKIYERK